MLCCCLVFVVARCWCVLLLSCVVCLFVVCLLIACLLFVCCVFEVLCGVGA